MDSSCGSSAAAGATAAPPEAMAKLGEGISLMFGRWTALQMAIENQWGGRDSRRKADDLAADVLSWFSLTKPPLYIDDLEYMLYEAMLQSLNTELVDGSIEEVAEKLMIMHEECLAGNFESIEKLRNSMPRINAVAASKQVVIGDAAEDSSSDEEEDSAMEIDNLTPESKVLDKPTPIKPAPDAEGWTFVPPKRGNKGKKSG